MINSMVFLGDITNGDGYRTDIFDKVGLSVPTNFEELVAACSTLRENNITPVAIGTDIYGLLPVGLII